jgi:hypothetical protein
MVGALFLCYTRDQLDMMSTISRFAFICFIALGCSKKTQELPAEKAIQPLKIPVSPEACKECLGRTACARLADQCSKFTEPGQKELCEGVKQCLETSNCADGKNTFTSCFCGPLSTSECIKAPTTGAGAPSGACADIIRKGLDGAEASNQQILERFMSLHHPAGVAIMQSNCAKEKGCAVQCGY